MMDRVDRIIKELEKLLSDADAIIYSYVNYEASLHNEPYCSARVRLIFPYAGSTLDRVAALKHVKSELIK
jgi:hypothetical protein